MNDTEQQFFGKQDEGYVTQTVEIEPHEKYYIYHRFIPCAGNGMHLIACQSSYIDIDGDEQRAIPRDGNHLFYCYECFRHYQDQNTFVGIFRQNLSEVTLIEHSIEGKKYRFWHMKENLKDRLAYAYSRREGMTLYPYG